MNRIGLPGLWRSDKKTARSSDRAVCCFKYFRCMYQLRRRRRRSHPAPRIPWPNKPKDAGSGTEPTDTKLSIIHLRGASFEYIEKQLEAGRIQVIGPLPSTKDMVKNFDATNRQRVRSRAQVDIAPWYVSGRLAHRICSKSENWACKRIASAPGTCCEAPKM